MSHRVIRIALLSATLAWSGCANREYRPENAFLNSGELGRAAVNRNASERSIRPMATANVAAAPSAAPPQSEPVKADPAAVQRVVIYSALIQIVVANAPATFDQVRTGTIEAGGYLQEQSNSAITVRIPAAKFDGVIDRISQLGEVVIKEIKAADITEEMTDLQIRIENSLKMRDRLLKLIEDSLKTQDTLMIETELQRLTESIERMKGRQRFLESQAAYSTIKVVINSSTPREQQPTGRVPFPWITGLGDGLVAGRAEARPRGDSWLNRGIRFDLPRTYIRYFVDDTHTEAMSAAGQLVKVQKHENYDRGDVAFWAELARKTLVEYRSIAITEKIDIKLDSGAAGVIFVGTRSVAGQRQGYLLALASNKDDIVAFEAWGPADQFAQDRAALEKTIKTIKLKP